MHLIYDEVWDGTHIVIHVVTAPLPDGTGAAILAKLGHHAPRDVLGGAKWGPGLHAAVAIVMGESKTGSLFLQRHVREVGKGLVIENDAGVDVERVEPVGLTLWDDESSRRHKGCAGESEKCGLDMHFVEFGMEKRI